MEWIAENAFFILVLIAFVAMHVFGHGSHAGHGRQGHSQDHRH